MHRYRTGISCKYWNKRIGQEQVIHFAKVVSDLRLDVGVMVSKRGFTGPAKTFAESEGIRLVELRKPQDRVWRFILLWYWIGVGYMTSSYDSPLRSQLTLIIEAV